MKQIQRGNTIRDKADKCICIYVCIMYVCMYEVMYVCMYACIYVSMFICVYISMYICMYV